MGPASTSPQALHGWTPEALSCSSRSCRAGTSVAQVLSWVTPCSASWFLRVVCAFLKKKVLPSRCSPQASCYLEQGAGGSCLEIALILHRRAPEHIPGFFIKKNSDIARSGLFLSWGLEVVCFEEVFLVMCAFSKKKVHSLTPVLKKSSEWCVLFGKKGALTVCSPRASCYLK